MSTWNLPPGVSTNDEWINPPDPDSFPTIMEICQQHHWPYPVSHSDGVAFFCLCEHLGIKTNTDDCAMAKIARGELDDPWPADKYPPMREYLDLLNVYGVAKIGSRPLTPRFIVVREGEGWAVGRHVATCNGVPVYSMVERHFEVIPEATAWVAAQEGSEIA